MSQLLVEGGGALAGEITLQGAKNSVLPILAATLVNRGVTVLHGCPRLRDVDASIRILQYLGCDARWEGEALVVDTSVLQRADICDGLMREMRSSAIFLGAILARCAEAELSYPGGYERAWRHARRRSRKQSGPAAPFIKNFRNPLYKSKRTFYNVERELRGEGRCGEDSLLAALQGTAR